MKMHITAEHPINRKRIDLYFVSIKQAKYFNPNLINFESRGSEWKSK